MQEREGNYKGHAVQRLEFNLQIRRVESGGAEPIDVVTCNFDDAFPSAAESSAGLSTTTSCRFYVPGTWGIDGGMM